MKFPSSCFFFEVMHHDTIFMKYIAIRAFPGVLMHIFITLEILGLSLVASISILNGLQDFSKNSRCALGTGLICFVS